MKTFFLISGLFVFLTARSQSTDTANLYNPTDDAEMAIAAAVKKAKTQHKFVLIQGGGNWCSWCKRFSITVANDAKLDSIVNADFVVYHLNYSEENKNEKSSRYAGYFNST